MPMDVKKLQKQFYAPGRSPAVVEVPMLRFAAVDGAGDPNEPDGAYKRALSKLYSVLYTIRMSPKSGLSFPGYETFVVAPLEGLWEQDSAAPGGGIDYTRKSDLRWTAMIQIPDFVVEDGFRAAVDAAQKKKGGDYTDVYLMPYAEGLCVQCMHTGPYDDEPVTLKKMRAFMHEQGFVPDPQRRHHEIYLSNPGRTAPDRLRTVLRIPVVPAASAAERQ